MPPRVSVLIPAFRAEQFVAAAMESVLAQSWHDWEIVAVDDASTDATWSILQRYVDQRIRVYRNASNLGMTANWNRCVALAEGELILKLDADDALRPAALAALVGRFDAEDIIAAGVRTLMCDVTLEPFDGTPADDAMITNGINPYADTIRRTGEWYAIAAFGHQLWSSSAFMVRRDLLRSMNGWDERFGCASDTDLILRTLEQPGRVAHCALVGNLYRVVPGSVSDEFRSQGWLRWEGVAAAMASLDRVRGKSALSSAMSMHFVRLWRRWQLRGDGLPDEMETRLTEVIRNVAPPTLAWRVITWLRDAIRLT